MNSLVLPSRYALFASFIICNAITCSIAVWNRSIAQAGGHNLGVDVFVTLLGASSLIFIFSIIILELVRKNSFTGHVWFEAAWVGFFFVLEFCAAVSVSAIGPGIMCTIQMTRIVNASCISTRVLLVFSWICTLLLLGYLSVLTTAAYVCKKENPRVWQCSVRQFFSSGARIYRADIDSPPLPRFMKDASPSIVAPQPHRPALQVIIPHNVDEGVNSFISPSGLPLPPIPAALPSQNTREATATSFYPKHLQSDIQSLPIATRPIRSMGTSPPPLGNWPRADIMSQPSRPKREAPRTLILASSSGPSSVLSNSRTSPASKASPNSGITPNSASYTLPSRSNGSPTGRARGAASRPPPLDLSKISSHSRPSK